MFNIQLQAPSPLGAPQHQPWPAPRDCIWQTRLVAAALQTRRVRVARLAGRENCIVAGLSGVGGSPCLSDAAGNTDSAEDGILSMGGTRDFIHLVTSWGMAQTLLLGAGLFETDIFLHARSGIFRRSSIVQVGSCPQC